MNTKIISKQQLEEQAIKFKNNMIDNINRETDPNRLIDIALKCIPQRNITMLDIYRRDDEFRTVIQNKNTPSVFLLYIYRYNKQNKVLNIGGQFDQRVHQNGTVYKIDDVIINAVRDELTTRNWQLLLCDKTMLSLDQIAYFQHKLDKEKYIALAKKDIPKNNIGNIIEEMLRDK